MGADEQSRAAKELEAGEEGEGEKGEGGAKDGGKGNAAEKNDNNCCEGQVVTVVFSMFVENK